jgi:hypothetical protein
MSTSSTARLAATILALVAGTALAATAPAFSVTDATGKVVQLADYKGRYVVLEWNNPDCPFVQAQYGADAMQSAQRDAAARKVLWLTINSTNRTHPEFRSGPQMAAWLGEQHASPTAVLIDADSTAGRAYAARTTPHMFVIDPAGAIVYQGAIDDRRSARVADRKGAHNYVKAALDDALSGQPVRVASTPPYGCSVKY